jgi:hypothetical protein
MHSHEYQVRIRDWLLALVPTLLVIGGLSVILKIANRHSLLPVVPPTLDPEMTVLTHQSLATHNAGAAEIILTGDSTCLAGVDAKELSRELPGQPAVLSLALFVWLDMNAYSEAVVDYASEHPNTNRAVVLLVTTTKLTEFHGDGGMDIWRRVHPKASAHVEEDAGTGADWSGARLLRRHLLSHILDTPLRGSGADYFGFSSRIDAYMTEHDGSLPTFGTTVLPRTKKAADKTHGFGDYVLSPAMREKSHAFREKLPAGTKLFIGLTPAIANTASPEEQRRRIALLSEWSSAIRADAVLTNLPPTLPAVFFSPGGHLNQAGQRIFTRLLAQELAPLLGKAER